MKPGQKSPATWAGNRLCLLCLSRYLQGVLTGDEALATAVAARLQIVTTDRWPSVAAHLIASGGDGEQVVELAGLPRNASGWEVDQLVPGALADVGAPEVNDEQAGEVVARLVAQGLPRDEFAILRTLAALAPMLDYPNGPIGEAYQLAEWLDCSCHDGSVEREEAGRFEQRLRRLPALNLSQGLAEALVQR